jgi:dipeptidyl aminopeptidase/acylaminoacyl peptidase
VIQTHGFNPKMSFSMDGLEDTASAFAARPLAAAGFLVLQAEDYTANTPQEGPEQMANYEGAIDYLDSRALVDRSAVAITGFSRTVFNVMYTLTHSRYQFAAADLADGFDGGYFQYFAFGGVGDQVFVNGGMPFGDNLKNWLATSPGFNLDKINTPIRSLAFGAAGGVIMGWHSFIGLRLLDKPVDFVLLPDAEHIVVKPWERMVAQQGLVDWFRFWLKGEEDSDPAKRDQYDRWRKLRSQYQASMVKGRDSERSKMRQ